MKAAHSPTPEAIPNAISIKASYTAPHIRHVTAQVKNYKTSEFVESNLTFNNDRLSYQVERGSMKKVRSIDAQTYTVNISPDEVETFTEVREPQEWMRKKWSLKDNVPVAVTITGSNLSEAIVINEPRRAIETFEAEYLDQTDMVRNFSLAAGISNDPATYDYTKLRDDYRHDQIVINQTRSDFLHEIFKQSGLTVQQLYQKFYTSGAQYSHLPK